MRVRQASFSHHVFNVYRRMKSSYMMDKAKSNVSKTIVSKREPWCRGGVTKEEKSPARAGDQRLGIDNKRAGALHRIKVVEREVGREPMVMGTAPEAITNIGLHPMSSTQRNVTLAEIMISGWDTGVPNDLRLTEIGGKATR